MKKFVTFIMMSMACMTWVSCDNHGQNTENTEQGSIYYEFPLEVQEEGFNASDNGVSINVSSVEEQNIVFRKIFGS